MDVLTPLFSISHVALFAYYSHCLKMAFGIGFCVRTGVVPLAGRRPILREQVPAR